MAPSYRLSKPNVIRVAFLYALLVALDCKVASLWLNGMVSLDVNLVADAKFRLAASVLLKSLLRSKWLSLENQSVRFTAELVETPWFASCPKTEFQSTTQRRGRQPSEPSTMSLKTNQTRTMFDETSSLKAQLSKLTKVEFELLPDLARTALSTAYSLIEVVPQGSSHPRSSVQMVN
ncbi:MAG: hypothetical protein ACI8T6_000730 [Candidatus Poseidoniaceae archaeon]|jgi:hypothetical protein